MVIASVVAYTFLTDFYPKHSAEYIAHKKNYQQIIKKRDLALLNAVKGTEVEQIVNEIKKTSNLELQNFTKKFNEIKKRDSFFGYVSFRVFLLDTSSHLLSFTLSLFFLFMVIKYVKGRFIKRYYLILSFVFVTTSGYWMAWSLINFEPDPKRGFDYPKSMYYIAIYILPTLVFVAAYYLFKYNTTIEKRLKEGIKLLIDYISIDIFDGRIKKEEKEIVLIENLKKFRELKNIVK